MSLTQNNTMHAQLVLGDALPAAIETSGNAQHLYVSLSDIILDSLFYHPSIEQHFANLSELEQESAQSILNDKEVSEHFTATIVDKVLSAVQESHQTIRVCLSDADSYAYKALLGGSVEPEEINPAMGVRGVSRFASQQYAKAFSYECSVIKALRNAGVNVEIVVPFVRTLSDAATIIDRLAEQGLPRGLQGLKVHYSCDVPSAALLAERLMHYFDGITINIDNLTQYTLGIDKNNAALAHLFNPESEAVVALLDLAVKAAYQAKKPILVVTQSLADYPKLQEHLVENTQADVVVKM